MIVCGKGVEQVMQVHAFHVIHPNFGPTGKLRSSSALKLSTASPNSSNLTQRLNLNVCLIKV